MPKKINRNIALIKYRNLPLQEYDKELDEYIFYYPESYSFYWVKVEQPTNKSLTLAFKKLIENMDFKELVILGQINKPWLSKYTRKRKDYKPLMRAVKYFRAIKLGKKFNGAIKIEISEIKKFISNLYTITQCDSGFYDYYITDVNENLLFHIHYSGEIKILTLNDNINQKLKEALLTTNFTDALRDGTDRL